MVILDLHQAQPRSRCKLVGWLLLAAQCTSMDWMGVDPAWAWQPCHGPTVESSACGAEPVGALARLTQKAEKPPHALHLRLASLSTVPEPFYSCQSFSPVGRNVCNCLYRLIATITVYQTDVVSYLLLVSLAHSLRISTESEATLTFAFVPCLNPRIRTQ